MVSLGKHHTGIVSESGDLMMCGAGGDGRLGLGDEGDRTKPTLIDPALLGHDAVLIVDCGACPKPTCSSSRVRQTVEESGALEARGTFVRPSDMPNIDESALQSVHVTRHRKHDVLTPAVAGEHRHATVETPKRQAVPASKTLPLYPASKTLSKSQT